MSRAAPVYSLPRGDSLIWVHAAGCAGRVTGGWEKGGGRGGVAPVAKQRRLSVTRPGWRAGECEWGETRGRRVLWPLALLRTDAVKSCGLKDVEDDVVRLDKQTFGVHARECGGVVSVWQERTSRTYLQRLRCGQRL